MSDELKKAQREVTEQRTRADRVTAQRDVLREKNSELLKKLKDAEGAGFIKGSALTVAHYAAALSDDALLMWLQAHVRAHVQRQPTDAAEVEKMVTAICERHGVELRGTRELIELVYEEKTEKGQP